MEISREDISTIRKGLSKYRKIPKLVWRIAEGLENRKIAVVAAQESLERLKLLLLESELFEKDNISHVLPDALDKLDDVDLILLDYAALHSDDEQSVREKLSELLRHKERGDGLIIYCKPPLRIPNGTADDMYTAIGDTPNTVVVTQYGRLLNDILVMMMTTPPKKKG